MLPLYNYCYEVAEFIIIAICLSGKKVGYLVECQ